VSTEIILTETVDRIGVIRLNRPDALNALNVDVMYAVVDAAEAFQADPNIMAIVLTGNEKAFAAGADIKEMNSKSYIEMQQADWVFTMEPVHCDPTTSHRGCKRLRTLAVAAN